MVNSKQNIWHEQHKFPKKKKCNACFYKPTITKKKTFLKKKINENIQQMQKISQISFPITKGKSIYIKIKKS